MTTLDEARMMEYYEELEEAQDYYDDRAYDDVKDRVEKDGFGRWVEDRMPVEINNIYKVRGTAKLNGERVEFEDEAECCVRAVNFGCEEIERGYYEEYYDIEYYWDLSYAEQAGYKDIEITGWTQLDG